MTKVARILALMAALMAFATVDWSPGLINQVERLFWGVASGVSLEGRPVSGYLAQEVRLLVRDAATRDEVSPVDACIHPDTGGVLEEKTGRVVDELATLHFVMACDAGGDVVPVYQAIPARWTAGDLRSLTRVLGEYSTRVGGSEERLHNVRLASDLVGHSLVLPGEVFSFNGTVGLPSEARGFLLAPVIVEEELTMGPGGGVCQVSTTLYNAAINAGMTIVERHPHSRPVGYVPEGMDAAVAHGYKNLRFRNPGLYPVILRMEVSGRLLRAYLLGR